MFNGGFMQFFCNWGYENYLITLQALQNIGATQTHALLRQMLAVIQHLQDYPQMQELWDIPRFLSDEETNRLDALDHAFWQQPDNIAALGLAHYAQ